MLLMQGFSCRLSNPRSHSSGCGFKISESGTSEFPQAALREVPKALDSVNTGVPRPNPIRFNLAPAEGRGLLAPADVLFTYLAAAASMPDTLPTRGRKFALTSERV
jgi:hypothetical protein